MLCPNCNANTASSKFCPDCGAALVSQQTAPNHVNRKKIGGWLLFFCAIITLWFPLSAFSAFFKYEEQMRAYGFEDPIVSAVGDIAFGSLVIASISVVCGILIWRGSMRGKRIAIGFLIAYPFLAALFSAVALQEIEGVPGAGQTRVDIVMYVVGKVIFSSIWLVYFFRSKRVKKYYSNDLIDNTAAV